MGDMSFVSLSLFFVYSWENPPGNPGWQNKIRIRTKWGWASEKKGVEVKVVERKPTAPS